MSRGQIKAMLYIVIFLLAAALFCVWLTGGDREDNIPEPEWELEFETTEPEVVLPLYGEPSAPPAQPTQTPAPTPSPTPAETPSITPAPLPTPTPMPTPTPTPAPERQSLGSGSFTSDTGTPMNIRADWTASVTGDTAEIELSVSLQCYAINMVGVAKSLHLCVGDEYVSLDVPAVEYSGNEAFTALLGSRKFTVSLASGESKTLPVAVEWHFGGTYGKDENGDPNVIDVVECGGSITLSR